jgi:hypothetical protein
MGYDRDVFSVSGDGYRLDLVSQPDVITVRRRDGSVFGYFGKRASREKIEQAIVEDGGRKNG